MACCPRDAAARRRRGVIARAMYAMRKDRRERAPPSLPLAVASPGASRHVVAADPTTASSGTAAVTPCRLHADAGVCAAGGPSSILPATSASRGAAAPEPQATPRRARYRRARLPLTQQELNAAARRAAPAFFDELTDGGRLPATVAVDRFPWQTEMEERAARSFAQILDLIPLARRQRDPRIRPVWACAVDMIAAAMLADLQPAFALARRRARPTCFTALPMQGRWGWRQRARISGYL